MTPETCFDIASLVRNIISRESRRLSSVFSTPIASKRFLIVPEDSSAARMPRPGATMASATRLSSVRFIKSPPCFLSVKSRLLLAQPQTRWPYPAPVISSRCPHAQEPARLADLTFHLLLCTFFCCNAATNPYLGMLRRAWGTQGSRDIAQTRINARKVVALSPPLVDAAALDGRAARRGTVVRHIQSPDRGHGL